MNAKESLNSYKKWLVRKNVLDIQIKNFVGVTEKDCIEGMTFSQPQGERVQTSGISDKTAKIALNYKKEMRKENKEHLEYMINEYRTIYEEMRFLEYGISTLSGYMPDLIGDMVIKGMKWDELTAKYRICHSMVAKYRRKAITELDRLYDEKNRLELGYMLS